MAKETKVEETKIPRYTFNTRNVTLVQGMKTMNKQKLSHVQGLEDFVLSQSPVDLQIAILSKPQLHFLQKMTVVPKFIR